MWRLLASVGSLVIAASAAAQQPAGPAQTAYCLACAAPVGVQRAAAAIPGLLAATDSDLASNRVDVIPRRMRGAMLGAVWGGLVGVFLGAVVGNSVDECGSEGPCGDFVGGIAGGAIGVVVGAVVGYMVTDEETQPAR